MEELTDKALEDVVSELREWEDVIRSRAVVDSFLRVRFRHGEFSVAGCGTAWWSTGGVRELSIRCCDCGDVFGIAIDTEHRREVADDAEVVSRRVLKVYSYSGNLDSESLVATLPRQVFSYYMDELNDYDERKLNKYPLSVGNSLICGRLRNLG